MEADANERRLLREVQPCEMGWCGWWKACRSRTKDFGCALHSPVVTWVFQDLIWGDGDLLILGMESEVGIGCELDVSARVYHSA